MKRKSYADERHLSLRNLDQRYRLELVSGKDLVAPSRGTFDKGTYVCSSFGKLQKQKRGFKLYLVLRTLFLPILRFHTSHIARGKDLGSADQYTIIHFIPFE